MNRFFLSTEAELDLLQVEADLLEKSDALVNRIVDAIEATLFSIGSYPYLGSPNSALTRLIGTEVRSRLALDYRIFYRLDGSAPEILRIIHTARDYPRIIAERLQ